jgi:hypothetical protein
MLDMSFEPSHQNKALFSALCVFLNLIQSGIF